MLLPSIRIHWQKRSGTDTQSGKLLTLYLKQVPGVHVQRSSRDHARHHNSYAYLI